MILSKNESTELRNLRKRIGSNIHTIRVRKKLTLKKLSRLSGISIVILDNYEMGKREISMPILIKIKNVLKVSIKMLIE